jgi:hypothetical protein
MNFFSELKRRKRLQGPDRFSESHRPCQMVVPSDLRFEIGHVLFVPSLAAKESAREGCALPVESRLNG